MIIILLSIAVPGKITVDNIKGHLLSTFTLQHIHYQHTSNTLEMDSLSITWKPLQLLKKSLHITQITIGETQIHIHDQLLNTTTQTKNHSDFSLAKLKKLYWLNIENINFKKITIYNKDMTLMSSGSLAIDWDVNLQINLPHLNAVISDIDGSLKNLTHITGSRFAPTIDSSFDIDDLSYLDNKIQHLHSTIHLSLIDKISSTATIAANDLLIADRKIKQVTLSSVGNFNYNVEDRNFSSIASISINQQPIINLNLGIKQQKIKGTIDLNVKDINLFKDFLPSTTKFGGKLHAHSQINGNLFKPSISTDINLNKAYLAISELGILLKNINLQAYVDPKKHAQLSGTFESTNGIASITGVVDLSQKSLPGTLTLKGNDLNLVKLSHYKVIVSPDLKLSFNTETVSLNGSLHIPEASITPSNFSSTTTLPDEVVFVDKKQPKNANYFSSLNLNIEVTLGDKIFIEYQDLQTYLTGKIKITQEAKRTTMATGELNTVKGKYTAYGQTLTIQHGKLIYTGNPLLNPGLNIRAIRQFKTFATNAGSSTFGNNSIMQESAYLGSDQVTVGVQINGTAQNPLISLFSSPAMNQGDTLSYLLFGAPQSQVKGSNQIGTLLAAASSINPSGKTTPIAKVTKNVKEKLGLNELTVGSTDIFDPTTGSTQSTTSFMVGKKVAKNLYIHYSIGLFNPVSILNLKYKLSKRWSIQSETSTIDSGGDLLYGLERN